MSLYKQYFKFGAILCTFSAYQYYKKQYNIDKQKSLVELKLSDQWKNNLHKNLSI